MTSETTSILSLLHFVLDNINPELMTGISMDAIWSYGGCRWIRCIWFD